jgi:D-3-phosphoglycerate dehydrogenase
VIPNGVGRAYKAKELTEALAGVDAIISGTDELTGGVLRSAPSLKTIAKHGVGVDNIDLDSARDLGVIVTSTPGAIHDSVADLTLALILALARQVIPAHQSMVEGNWKGFIGSELRGKTLGIVGLGRIGKEVCVRGKAFGMNVIAFDPYPNETFAAEHLVTFVNLDELLANSDYVSVHAGVAQPERPMLGAVEFALMKPGARLINTARGNLIDEAALAAALNDGRLAGAGLDVFASEPPAGSPLITCSNVVLTPHIGGQTREGLLRMGQMTVDNCLAALAGRPPHYRVP